MTFEELKRALDGLFAYDNGAVSSGIRDELLRRRCIDALHAMSDRDRARLVRDMWLTEEALDQGYGFEDLTSFVRWLNEDMEQA